MDHLLTLQALLAIACGSLVGFSLALIGGGGSILAVPLLLYVVGIHDPHLAIGTGALAVSLNAFANLLPHARASHVRWKVAFAFAPCGIVGAFVGSTIGKAVNGRHLLILFALLMLVVAALMLRGRRAGVDRYPLPHMVPRLAGVGLGTGALAGFFGIGGGFLIVPGLMFASGLEIIYAIGTSLFAVGMFSLTTTINYAASGLIDWPVAAEFIIGGIVGGWLGALGARRLAKTRGALNLIFALAIIAVAILMLVKSLRG